MSTSFEAIGASSGNFNACAPTPPAGSGTGFLAIVFWGNASGAPLVYDDEVWTYVGDVVGGEGSWAVDSGRRHVSAFWTEDAITDPQTFTNGDGDGVTSLTFGYILRFTKTLAYWDRATIAEAVDDLGGAGFSGTFNRDPGAEVGDTAVIALVANNDTITNPPVTFTWPGTTGTITPRASSAVGTGNDARVAVRDRTTATGPSTGTPTITSTTDFTGAVLLVRLRDTDTAPAAAPVASVPADAVVEPWLDFELDGSASTYQPGATFAWSDVTVGGTGTVVIDNPTALVTTAHVDPTVWADEDYQFELEVTDAGGTSTVTVTKTVLRSSEMIRTGGVDKPLRLTF